MKRFFMKMISILGCVLFAFLPLSMSAFALELYDDVDDFASVINVNNIETITLDNESLDNMSRKMNRLSNEEKVDLILKRFDIETLKSTKQYDQIMGNFDDVKFISASTAYIKVDEFGNQTVMSKEDCLREVKEEKSSLQKTRSISDVWEEGEKESSNGYMMQRIISIYNVNDPKGTYTILCASKWLNTPMIRLIDAMSVSSKEMKWSENVEDYSGLAVYDKTTRNHNGNSITENTEYVEVDLKTPLMYDANKGFSYKWDVPSNTSYVSGGYGVSNSYTNFATLILGKARVINYNTVSQMISVDYRYLHVQVQTDVKNIVFELIQNKEQKWYITLAKYFSLFQKNYDYSHTWDYSKHANL